MRHAHHAFPEALRLEAPAASPLAVILLLARHLATPLLQRRIVVFRVGLLRSVRWSGHRGERRRILWRGRSPRPSPMGLGRVKTFSCKRSELDQVATRAIFPDVDYALIAAISG